MGAVTIKTNGQILKLTAAKNHEDQSTATVYSDSVGGTPVSLPATLSTDTTYYLVNGARQLTITQADGTAFHDYRVDVQAAKTQVVEPRPGVLEQLADLETIKTKILWGAGTPESAITATVGTLFLRTDGSTSTTLYVKTSGSGSTGWTAK